MSLFVFAAILALCMIPATLAARRDPRKIRGVNVWAKPLKFLAALALFSATTAVLMRAAGPGAPLAAIEALIVATSTFEAAYITCQASRGEPSHYNTSDALHTALTVLMACGAIALTASQAWLAWTIMDTNPAWRASVTVLGTVTGLLMTFVLATVSGVLLGGKRAPAGAGLPLVGWRRVGDARPAHFMGVHAQQIIPAFGFIADRLLGSAAHMGFTAMTATYVLAWAALTRMQLKQRTVATAAA
jgi:hypothetical protein